MSFLQRIGLRSKKARPVGTTLERGDTGDAANRRKNIAIKVGIFGTLLVVTLAVFPIGHVYEFTIQVDEVWRQENLIAPFTFPIEKSSEERQQDRRQIRLTEPAIFTRIAANRSDLADRRDSLSTSLESMFSKYASFQENLSRGRMEEARSDSLAYVRARNALGLGLNQRQWNLLLGSFAATIPGLTAPSRTAAPQRLDEALLAEAYNRAVQILQNEVIDVPIDSVYSDRITVRNEAAQSQQSVSKSQIRGIEEAIDMARTAFKNRHPSEPEVAAIALVFFTNIFQPSLQYDMAATEERWLAAERARSPTRNVVMQNEVIVRKGDRITDDIHRKLVSLEKELLEKSGSSLSAQRFLGHFILILATYLIFFLYLFLLRRPIFDDNQMLFLIALLFLGILGIYGVAMRAALDMYLVPVAAVAIMLTVIFDSRVALFATLTLSLIGAHLLSYDMEFMFSTMFAGTLGIFSVRDIRNRSQFFLSAGLVFIGYVAIIGATYLLQNMTFDRFSDQIVYAAINSVLLLLAYPMLWVFERVFDLATDLTLLEMSDTNRPLLKELSMQAPGTFNHVLQVANLSEAAATAIGANALLTRVGALYHDIGKMSKPEYFVENQRDMKSPHDQLKPRMSALIISNHVKEGLELAKKYRIPKRVQDFIPMHHGTSRIQFFYHRALEQQKIDGTQVMESEFRYPGPKPNSAETSILMLADSVEAAARSIENPNHKRLETLIDAIVQDRIRDGQLDESGLTFTDVKRVKETFLTVLMGFYHLRVKYPGDEEQKEEDLKEQEPKQLPESKSESSESRVETAADKGPEEDEAAKAVPDTDEVKKAVPGTDDAKKAGPGNEETTSVGDEIPDSID